MEITITNVLNEYIDKNYLVVKSFRNGLVTLKTNSIDQSATILSLLIDGNPQMRLAHYTINETDLWFITLAHFEMKEGV